MSLRRSPVIHSSLLVVLGLLIYSNIFHAPFVFDDFPNIMENPFIRQTSNIPSMFAGGIGSFSSRPLMHATFAFNYHFGGLDPRGYHAVNLALHLINGVLLYFLVVMTGRLLRYTDESARTVALLASLLFVAHPVQTEAVTYVVSRSMLLATAFYLSGIMLFAKAATAERRKWPYIAGLFVVSLLGAASRENFITFPIMLVLYDLFFISNFRAKEALGRWKLYIPVLLACAYLVYLVLNNTYDLKAEFPDKAIPPLQYVLTQLNVHWTYLRLLALPINQNLDYAYPISQTLLELPTILSFAGYLGLWAGAMIFARRRPVVSFSVLWFFIALAPISIGLAFTKLRLGDVIFEHRLYLPSAGVIAAFAAVAVSSAGQFKDAWARKAVAVCLVFALAVFSIAAYKRNGVWRSKIALWTDVIGKSPGNVRGQLSLANAYAAEGLLDEAINFYRITLSGYSPYVPASYYAMAHMNLANVYLEKNLGDEAITHYETAISLAPKYSPAYSGLGDAYMARGLIDTAIEYYRKSVQLNPRFPIGYNSLGLAYFKRGLVDMAIESYKEAITIDSRYAVAYSNLGMAYAEKGLNDKAIEYYELAINVDPRYATAYSNLGSVYGSLGQFDKAVEYLLAAIETDPGNAQAYNNLGSVYGSMGMMKEAEENFRIAIRLKPGFAEAYNNLGIAYSSMGRYDKAIESFGAALNLWPDNADVHMNIGIAYSGMGMRERAELHFRRARELGMTK